MAKAPYSSWLLTPPHTHTCTQHMHPLSHSPIDSLCESGIRGNMSLVIPWQHLQCAIVTVQINWQEIKSSEMESWESRTCSSNGDKVHMLATNMADASMPDCSYTQHCPKQKLQVNNYWQNTHQLLLLSPLPFLKSQWNTDLSPSYVCPFGIWHCQLNICCCGLPLPCLEPSRISAFRISQIQQTAPSQPVSKHLLNPTVKDNVPGTREETKKYSPVKSQIAQVEEIRSTYMEEHGC